MSSRWLRAIEQILLEADAPLSAEEIARAAIARQLVSQTSQWPELSVTGTIRRHLQKGGNALGIALSMNGRANLYAIPRRKTDNHPSASRETS